MSSDFELFDKALAQFEQIQIDNNSHNISKSCCHPDVIQENGIISCVVCGE